MTKKTRGKLWGIGIAVFLLIALLVFLFVWFFGARYPVFDGAAESLAEIPALHEDFVPQGVCALPEGSGYDYAVSGYMKKGASRVYFVGKDGAKYIRVSEGGNDLTAHFGGVAATENYLILTVGKSLVRVPLSDALSAKEGTALPYHDKLATETSNAFVSVSGNTLFAGEFYRKGNYETDKSHHVTVDGIENRALVACYTIDDGAEGGVTDKTPFAYLSVRGLVQGLAIEGEDLYLSCSWGLADSTLCRYKDPLGGETDLTVTVGGKSVPCYFLGKAESEKKVPCMSEGIAVKEGKLVVLFESGSYKYRQFVRRRTEELVALPLDFFA